jgi:hypothetical protein
MITVLSITSLVAIIGAIYFAYGKKTADVKLQDYIAKYESVKTYAETLTQASKATTSVKSTAAKTGKSMKVAEAPKRRGRKPSAK